MRTAIIVPARYGSTRFPGKPLAPIAGVPMLDRVVAVAQRAGRDLDAWVAVATDDQRILDHVRGLEVDAVMTDADLSTGTDRVCAALNHARHEIDFALNLQGDAPFTPPAHLVAIADAARDGVGTADAVTPVVKLSWTDLDVLREQKRRQPFSGTTCVRDVDARALWFSKQIIPVIRREEELRRSGAPCPVFRHIGLYGYRRAALERFVSSPPAHYEQLEGLEQLRFLENGMTIETVEVDAPVLSMTGIDTPDDVALAETLIAEHGDPHFMGGT